MESLGKIKDKNAWKVLHQTGEGDSDRIQRKYRALGIKFELKKKFYVLWVLDTM